MSIEKVFRVITANIGAKIVSLLFAVLLWLHVTGQQGENQFFRVPLVLSGIPDSLTVIHEYPRAVGTAQCL
jgi:YbbR domain-containing protein